MVFRERKRPTRYDAEVGGAYSMMLLTLKSKNKKTKKTITLNSNKTYQIGIPVSIIFKEAE